MSWRANTATADDDERAAIAERNRKRRRMASKVAEKVTPIYLHCYR